MTHMKYYVECKNNEDLYLLPSTNPHKAIVYSPLRGIAFMTDIEIANLLYNGDTSSSIVRHIQDEIKHIKINSNFPIENQLSISGNLIFLLSNSCNLGCTYCYAQYNRQNDVLSKEKIQSVIDYTFSLHVNDEEEMDISFLGGGEPMFHWELLTWAILYIRQKADYLNMNVRIGFPTNGTLLNEERIRFLADNNVQIGLSFDILPEIQNSQRPFAHSDIGTYDIVSKNIDLLAQYGIQTRFRTTITPEIVSRMKEMVLHTFQCFPSVKKIHFEPIYPTENDKSSNNNKDVFYDEFIRSYMTAYKTGLSLGIQVKTSVTNTLCKIKQRYCKGELCVTPNGDIVICHRASSQKDIRFSTLNYGKVDETGVHINSIQFDSIQQKIIDIPKKCKECYSKWHCAGMCISNRMMFSKAHYDSYCKYVRTLQSRYIENIIIEGGVKL